MRKVSRSRLSAGCAGLCLMLAPATAFGQVTEPFPAPEGGYTRESAIELRGRAIDASNRMYMQTRPGAKICDIDEYRAALAEMERAAAEFHRLAQAVTETGAPAGLNPGYFSFNDRDIQGLLKRWRTLLPECERASAVGQPISEEVLSSLYPPAPAPPAAQPAPPAPTLAQTLAPLQAGLDTAIGACDAAAFKAAKNRLLEQIGQMISQSPDNPELLKERRRIEETQLPRPCPPESRTSPPVTQAPGPQDPPLAGHDDILDEIGDEIGTTQTGLPRPPAPPVPPRKPEEVHVRPDPTPAAEPRRAAPPVPPRKPEEIHVPPKPVATAASLRDQALTANFRHAQASDPCDAAAMARHLQELDRLVNEAEMEMHSWDGPMYRETWMRKAEDYQEIQKIRDAARKRQADCPKDRRVGLNPQDQQFLALHNQARSEVGAKPLEWDPALAAGAKAYAIQLTSAGQLVHSSREGRKDIRENLLQSRPGQSLQAMIGVWTAEKRYFKPGVFPDVSTTGDWADTGHWTQMTWATTTRVGCATHGDTRFTWLVCRYSPPGNRDGTAVGQENPRPPVLANQDGIAPANSTTTTAPPPPPPPPTARDPAPDGDETRHPLVTMANGAFDAFTAARRDGDRAAQERELAKLRYALDELRKRLKAARKAGPYSTVDPTKVEKQVKDLERMVKTAEDRFNGRGEYG